MRKVHIVGNWKMNQNLEELTSFANSIKDMNSSCEAWIAPQAIHISKLKELAPNIKVGSQNCSDHNSGAFTGELSPASLKDLGAHFVIIGHSERRAIFNESNSLLNMKTQRALENNLKVIFCVGETLEERESGDFKSILKDQLVSGLKDIDPSNQENILIAYEPVWAIGTGKVATPEQAQEVHAFLRQEMKAISAVNEQSTPILYGGSVKPGNIEGLLKNEDIDGALVGGASLKAESYMELCNLSK